MPHWSEFPERTEPLGQALSATLLEEQAPETTGTPWKYGLPFFYPEGVVDRPNMSWRFRQTGYPASRSGRYSEWTTRADLLGVKKPIPTGCCRNSDDRNFLGSLPWDSIVASRRQDKECITKKVRKRPSKIDRK